MKNSDWKLILLLMAFVVLINACSSNSTEENPQPEVLANEEIIVTAVRVGKSRDSYRKTPDPQDLVHKSPAEKGYWAPEQFHQIFRDYGVNPTILTKAKPVSTFALDVDDGSYKLALEMLRYGNMPQPQGIRVEEFINAQDYRYIATEDAFSLSAELAPSPFRPGYHLLHLGLQSRKLNKQERPPANLVLVADVSGSMAEDEKLVLLKKSFITLVKQLREDDQVAIVSYADSAELVLAPTRAFNRRMLINAISSLDHGGGTNAAQGIKLAYDIASRMYERDSINRVLLSSDGMANIGATSPEKILNKIERFRKKNIFLTTLGLGRSMYNDALLEQLANQGDGVYLYISSDDDIRSAFVDRINSTLQTVAKNAKAQIQFDSQSISHYRLLGYENRSLEKEDFLDTKKDGGELGAGQKVTALYEVKLQADGYEENIASFQIAYQDPRSNTLKLITKPISYRVVKASIEDSSSDFRLSAAVAAFAERLRKSYWSQLYDYADIIRVVSDIAVEHQDYQTYDDLLEALRQAQILDRSTPKKWQASRRSKDFDLDHVPLLQ